MDRDELLRSIDVSDDLLNISNDNVERLKAENENIKEKFEKFQKAAESQKEMELNRIRQQYNEESKHDKQQAIQKYWTEHKRILTEFKNEIRVGESKLSEMND